MNELILKYNKQIPRYTSFPTVPEWKKNLSQEQWLEELKKEDFTKPVSIYIHIPFCYKICSFCACNKVLLENPEYITKYLKALEKEIVYYKEALGLEKTGLKKILVSQLHFGGGTPTTIPASQMERMLTMLSQYFEYTPNCEKSLEAHPEFTTKEQISVLASHNFTRISFGIQDFTHKVQKVIGRVQSYEKITEIVKYTRKVGISQINFDYIYGLPFQNKNCISDMLTKTKELSPDRIAFYSYANVPWKSAGQKKLNDGLPTPEAKLEMFLHGKEGFESLGYEAIGMDHFAKKNDPLFQAMAMGNLHRNFMGYTTKTSNVLLGFGVSSISETPNAYKQNEKSLLKWQEDFCLIENSHKLSEFEVNLKSIILSVMTQFQAPINLVNEEKLPQIQEMVEDGLIVIEDEILKVTQKGRIFLRNIAYLFDSHISQEQKFSTSV